jgi:tetratricopeptide (TPR) repeat protein
MPGSPEPLDVLRLAESDPRRAIELAATAVRQAAADEDFSAAAVAERAWGLAALHLDNVDVAVQHLRAAIRHGRRARSTALVAEARVTMAGLLSGRGRPAAALRELEVALGDLSGVGRARAQAQRGAILHQIGRLDEAMQCYRAALPVLRRTDPVWAARTLMNRGVLHGQRQEFAAGMDDLWSAEQLYRELDLTLSVGFVHQNQGFVQAHRGDVPAALGFLGQAESCFRQLRSQLGELLSDQADLLLSVRLIAEARHAADEAVRACEQEGRGLLLPEARLTLARAALLDGAVGEARGQASLAVGEFSRQRRFEWAALARLTVLDCELADPEPRRISVARVESTAAAVARLWPAAAVEAKLSAARVALRRNRPREAGRLLADAARWRTRGPATVRARAWFAEALRRYRAGERTGALHAARAGLRVLDDHVASLGATDLRAHSAGHRTELADLGLRIALDGGRPDGIFRWAEAGRASHLVRHPARPPDDPFLAAAVAELRETVTEIRLLRRDGVGDAVLDRRLLALERTVRDYHRQHTAPGQAELSAAPSAAGLADALPDVVVLEFFVIDGTLHVVIIVNGRIRVRDLGSFAVVRELLDRLPFVLRRLTRPTTAASRLAATELLRSTVAELDAVLFAPVPEIGDRDLALIPTGPLQSVPWALLPSCTGRPLTVAPSAAMLYAASVGPTPAGGGVVVVAGPGLPGALHEANSIGEIHRSNPMTGGAASVAAVTAALDGGRLAHLATHGHVRADNPLFSSLELVDGPLMVYDLERLDRTPDTVVLAACDTGRPVVRAGDELLGLSATLLARGTRRLVAPVLAILDLDTAPLMIAFHRHLVAGRPVASALALAQQQTADCHPGGLAATGGFVCLGAGLRT